MLRAGVKPTLIGILISAAALVLSPVGAMAASTWTTQSLDANGHYHGVFAIDGCHVWAVGEEINGRSQVFKTADNNDNAVSVVAGGTFAWAVGESGTVSANTPAATACPAAAAAAPVAVVPTLPNAGHPLMPVEYDWMLLLLIPAIGVLGWISVKPD